MKLNGFGESVEQPSAEQLEEALRSLPGGPDSFAILTRSEGSYIQVLGGGESGYVLEYQEGSLDRHYFCPDPDLGIDAVVAAFQSYARDDDDWRTALSWRRQKLAKRVRTLERVNTARLFLIVLAAAIVLPPLLGLLLLRWTSIDAGNIVRAVGAIEALPLVFGGTIGLFWLDGKRRARVRDRLAKSGVRTEGVVLDARTTITRDEERGVQRHTVRCRYETPVGTRVKRQSVTGKTLHGVSIGDRLTVIYDPKRVRRALLKFGHRPRRTKGVVPRPPQAKKGRRLDLRSTILPSLGIALGAMALLSVLEVLFRGEQGLRGTLSSALLCRAPARLAVWSLVAGLGLVLLRPALRRERALAPYREQIARHLRREPRSEQNVVACPYCGREILPGTGRCAYCCLQVNAGRRRTGSGLLLLFASLAMVGFWGSVARDRYALDGVMLSLAGVGAALWLLYTGISEWRWWRRL
jgi:hypothetical protein